MQDRSYTVCRFMIRIDYELVVSSGIYAPEKIENMITGIFQGYDGIWTEVTSGRRIIVNCREVSWYHQTYKCMFELYRKPWFREYVKEILYYHSNDLYEHTKTYEPEDFLRIISGYDI